MRKFYSILAVALMTSLSMFAGEWVKPTLPTPQALDFASTVSANESEAAACYLYNVEYGGYYLGANSWGTRASLSKTAPMEVKIVEFNGKYGILKNGGTYASPDGPTGIWIDGTRLNYDQFVFALNGNQFTITCPPVGGDDAFLSCFADTTAANPELNLTTEAAATEAGTTLCKTWILTDIEATKALLSQETLDNYNKELTRYNTAMDLKKAIDEAAAKYPGIDLAAPQKVYENTGSTTEELVAAQDAVKKAAQHQDGDYVYTTKSCYQITDATNYYTGGVNLKGWTPITATDKTLGDIFSIDTDETGVTYFKSLAADQNEGMSYSVTLPAGYYVMSVKICGPAAAAKTPLQSTHCSDAYVYTKHPDWLNYINVVQDDTIATSVDEETIEAAWQTLAFGFESNGASEYKIVLKGINANVKIADIAIQPALPAPDLRKKDFALKYAQATLTALGLDETTLPKDLKEVYTTFKGMDETTTVEEFEAYLEEFNAVMAEFRAMNFDDQLTDADSHFPYYEGTSKKQKFSTYGSWNCYPSGRGFVDPAPGYVHMGHCQGSAAWAWTAGEFCGIDQTVELDAGKYIFKTELQGFYRRENGGSWEPDNSIKATEGYMFAVRAAGDTIATTGWYDVSGAVYTPNFIVFELAEKTTVTLGAKVYDYALYQGTIRGGALNVLNVEFWGKTNAKYSKAEYNYEADVRGQITAGRDALTTAQGYVDSDEYKWGKAELSQVIAAVEPLIGAYEAMDEDAIIATYNPDLYLAGGGLEAMDEDSTYYVRLLASEVYRTGIKVILDANEAFIAKNDILNSLADAIAKAEAELVNRVYGASSKRAQLEAELATAKTLLATMQAGEYSQENAASIVAENEALAAAVVTFKVIPADKLATVVDIDFNQFTVDGANVPEGPDATIEGAKGSMVFTNFSNVTSGAVQSFEVGVDNAGVKDSVNVLRVGNGTATVDVAANMVGTTNILRVSMDWWFGQLSGKYNGFYLKDSDDNNVAGINLSAYDGKCNYDPCDMVGKFGVGTFTVSARNGNAAHCVESNKTNIVLYLDYGTNQMQMVTTTPNGTYESDWVTFDGQEVAKFVLSGDYTNSDRRSWFDNLKIGVIGDYQPVSTPEVVYNDDFEDWTSTNHDYYSTSENSWNLACVPNTTLSFDYAVSSRQNYDYLTVYLDGKVIIIESGESAASFKTVIPDAGNHVLKAVYSRSNYSSKGSDQASIRNVALSADVTQILAGIQAQCDSLIGFDALTGLLKTSASKINSLINEAADQAIIMKEISSLQDSLKLALDVKEKYWSLYELANQYKELYAVTKNEGLGVALDQAYSLIAEKATLTTESLESLEKASKAITSAIGAMGITGTKVWNFEFSKETLDALSYSSNYIGDWSNYGNYYRYSSSTDSYDQLSYYVNQGDSLVRYYIPETEGLYFNRGGYRWGVCNDGTNRLYIGNSGSSYAFKIPNLKKGQVITINYSPDYEGNYCGIRQLYDNTRLIDGQETATSMAEVVYEVTSDGDAIFYPYNGSMYINSISLTALGDPLRLAELRKTIADYITTLDAFPGLKAELQMACDKAVVTGEDADLVESHIQNLKGVWENVKKAIEVYPIILADIDTAKVVLTEGAYVDVAEAVELGTAIDVNTSESVEYLSAFEALETALAIYSSDKVEMSDWAFDTNNVYTVDGLRYNLDMTNNLAEFINFNNSNAYTGALNIPATIRYNGITYAVVAMINNNRNTQENITSVTLPKTLRYIGDYGLGYMSNVRSIEIPENVTSMGRYVFSNSYNLTSIKVNALVPPTISSMSGSSYKKITIPAESFHAYRLASVWNENILIGDDGVVVSTGRIAAGDLGHVILDEAGYLQEVNKLIIDEGALNNDDWNAIRSMTNLIEIDLSGVTMSALPASAFEGRWAIEKVVLPRNLASIGSAAFYGTGIKEINLPGTLTSLESYAFYNCDSLSSVVIPDSVKNIPYHCFYNCENLRSVELPDGLTTIEESAFSECYMLSNVVLPPNLTSIGGNAFYYCPIKKIDIPAGVTSIANSSFAYNTAIDSLVIPATVKTIEAYAFRNCYSLKSVQFNEGLTNIYSSAFENCTALTEVVLPSSLERCEGSPFYGCTGIKKMEARSVIPPTTGGSCPMNNVNLTDVVLYVPSWSTGEYQLANGWSSFFTIEASDFLPQYIKVNKDFYFTLRDTLAADYRPNIEMTYSDVQSTDAYGYYNYERGNLTVSGRSMLAVNDFSMVVSPFAKYYADENVMYGYEYDNYRTNLNSTSLIVNGDMRAENVCMHLNNYNNRWQFVTFPFDVKVSDIVPQSENTSWVIRGHSGANRAAGLTDSVWVNLTAEDVLEAGKGYIMHNYNPDHSNSWFWVYPLKNSVNRQLIFSSEDRTIELEENLAEFDHNRSWNLIGNPYPCFYDTRFMDFGAPFMVWNSYNQNYVAYNPADDAYILSPGEAFFVQRPFDQESIIFLKEGRQTNRYAREMSYAPARTNAAGGNVRTIFNLTLQHDSLIDRTRVVFNDAASLGYDMKHDAAKFASAERSVPQIFTVAGNTRYAINERPFTNGDVVLGVYCGTDGEYTISVDKTYDGKVVLEDKLANMSVELTPEKGYTFGTFAGESLNRFVLHFQGVVDGIEDVNYGAADDGNATYNLQGIKVNKPNASGIYIENGLKKVIK